MRTIVITGGTDGMGKQTALHFLKKGEQVLVVGSTPAKGERFLAEAHKLGTGARATFIQTDLSSIAANHRLIERIRADVTQLDALVLCAGKFQNHYQTTADGFETVFATYYLSRFLLSYGLRDLLEQSQNPLILNVAAPGVNGEIQWEDLQFRNRFDGLKASFHGSRLNDLLGVAFAANHPRSTIKFILYNPGFVRTAGVTEAFNNPIARGIVKVIASVAGLSPAQGAAPIIELLEQPPTAPFSAYQRRKPVDLTMSTFDPQKAQRLYTLTQHLLEAKGVATEDSLSSQPILT